MKKFDKGSIIRTIVLGVAMLNQVLVMNGVETIPFTGEGLEMFLTNAFSVVAIVIAWFKNNFITQKGQEQKKALQKEGLTSAK